MALLSGPAALAQGCESGRGGLPISLEEQLRIREALDPIAPLAKEEGGWSGGGGGGIICFKDWESRREAFDSGGNLRNDKLDLSKVVFLRGLDSVESAYWLDGNAFPVERGETPRAYLERILSQRVAKLAPKLAAELKRALDLLYSQPWNDNPSLKFVHDVGKYEVRTIPREVRYPAACHYVQLFVRYQRKQKDGRSLVFIDYHRALFDHLAQSAKMGGGGPGAAEAGVFHQSVMLLHEALSVLMMESGAKEEDTSNVRAVTLYLLNQDWYDLISPGDISLRKMPLDQRSRRYRRHLARHGFDLDGTGRIGEFYNPPFVLEPRQGMFSRILDALRGDPALSE